MGTRTSTSSSGRGCSFTSTRATRSGSSSADESCGPGGQGSAPWAGLDCARTSTRLIGTLTAPYAEATGLEPGIPIAAGCGDTAAGLLGAGLVVPGESVDTAGTASVLTFCSTEFRPDVEKAALLSCRSVVDGLWYSLAYINGGGLCIEWFADQLQSDWQAV